MCLCEPQKGVRTHSLHPLPPSQLESCLYPTVQRGEVGRHTSDQRVPSFSSSLSPSHYPPPGLGKRWALLLVLHSIPVENRALRSRDGRVLFLLWDPLGLVSDMLKRKKKKNKGVWEIISQNHSLGTNAFILLYPCFSCQELYIILFFSLSIFIMNSLPLSGRSLSQTDWAKGHGL